MQYLAPMKTDFIYLESNLALTQEQEEDIDTAVRFLLSLSACAKMLPKYVSQHAAVL